jgi:N-acetylglucosamine-6-phosphate deacetylase
MTTRGRIPGRRGLWEIRSSGSTITACACVDDEYNEEKALWITPGLVDLQVNGAGGVDFSNPDTSLDALSAADRALAARGVSRYCPTLITRDAAALLAAVRRLGEAWMRGAMPGAVALHLEGPYVSGEEGYRGIHQARFTRDPDPAELARLQEACGGRIRIVTLAPERPGARDLIRAGTARGVIFSMGHSRATRGEISAAVQAGLSMSTHLFNGCPQVMERHANVVFSQLAEDRLRACFIADGRHVPLHVLKIALRAKGTARSILVSDMAPLSGLPDGEYRMEGNAVVMENGGIWVKGSYLLSGAALPLDRDVEVLAREPEPGIEAALLMATDNPAAVLGLETAADLRPGRRGPLAVFQWDGRDLTLCAGEV